MVDNNITICVLPGAQIWKQFLAQSSIPEYNKLAETIYITKDWDEYDNCTEYLVVGKGTHATMVSYLYPYQFDMGRWYRSKEKLRGFYPYRGYLTNKKWFLNEV